FWGGVYGSIDRVRGFSMVGPEFKKGLRGLTDDAKSANFRYLFGGPDSAPLPSFAEPNKGLRSEGYFANALYQIHRALTHPGVGFADSPAYWHGYNTNLSDTQSQRFSDTIWKALERFQADPPLKDRASEVFLNKLLSQFQAAQPAFTQIAQTIFELNNQLMPTVEVTEGTSDSSPGTPVGERVNVRELETKSLIVRVRDATGKPLRGYNLNFDIGSPADFDFRPLGAGPAVEHGRVPSTGLNRATNANGIVNVVYEAPPLSANTTQTMRVSYQPDFDTDATLSPPGMADDLETTLRKLYLHELRTVAKIWAGTGNNFGAKVTKTVTFDVKPS
ncbi:MAG: hypothetical protein M3118_07680, partial [Actinomycetota bacterium]|nr:hypothetical protein [Actinomycetota bacterium]